jgi:phosphatidylglycerol:prolipoprotein diacylglycerol transferase
MPEAAWFDPVAFYLGPFPIRWYALAYVTGFIAAFMWAKRSYFPRHQVPLKLLDPFMNAMIISVIVGGRLGHIVFYDMARAIDDPLWVFKVWQGGMSFHGAVIGLICGLWVFSSRHSLSFWLLSDFVSIVAPWGIFLGRLANFVNGELVGRITDVPWGVVFPMVDQFPRHPSQLYEAATEGMLLGLLMWFLQKKNLSQGLVTGVFLCLYAVIRFVMEYFRVPECPYGCYGHFDMGQILSILMFILGSFILMCKRQD